MVAMESDSELDRGDAAPAFELPGTDGETYTLDSFDADTLLLVFTCNHCPYAQAKFDLLNDLAAEYDDLAVVGINPNDATEYPDDSVEAMRERRRRRHDRVRRLPPRRDRRSGGRVRRGLYPDPFLFGRDGDAFRLQYHGRLDDALNPDDEPTEFYIRDAVDAVLAGEEVEVPDRPSRGCSIKWPDE